MYDALKSDLLRLASIRELNPDEKAALSYLEAPNGGEPPQVVRALERERQIVNMVKPPKAELLDLHSRLQPAPTEVWSLIPPERVPTEDKPLWELIRTLENDYDVKLPVRPECYTDSTLCGSIGTRDGFCRITNRYGCQLLDDRGDPS